MSRLTMAAAFSLFTFAACSGEASEGFGTEENPGTINGGEGGGSPGGAGNGSSTPMNPAPEGESPRQAGHVTIAGGHAESDSYRARLVVSTPSRAGNGSSRIQLIVPEANEASR